MLVAFYNSAFEGLKQALGLTSIATVDVIHRAYKCFGIVIKHEDDWSIVYVCSVPIS
jgi:hypothetical protein